MSIANMHRLEWAIRTRQWWPLIKKIEKVSYEEYRTVKERIRAENRAKAGKPHDA